MIFSFRKHNVERVDSRTTTAKQLTVLAALALFVLAACKPEEATTQASSPGPGNSAAPATSPASADPAAAFDASSDVLFAAKTPADLSKLTVLQQAELSEAPDGLSLKALGNDPGFFLPEFSVKPCIVKIEVTSPADTVLQIFYPAGPSATYSEQNSVVQRIKTGRNSVYLRIDKANPTGKWRVDPGDIPGTYVIHSIEVRGLAGGTR